MTEKETCGISELLELAKDGRREVEWVIDLLAIPDESLESLKAAIFLNAGKITPSGNTGELEKYQKMFDRLCESMPHVSRECLELLGISCVSIGLFFMQFERGELSVRDGALHLTTAAMARGAATALLPASVGYLSEKVQAVRKAALSEAGRQGALVRLQPYEELKKWALEKGAKLGASKVVARTLARQLPPHLTDVSEDPGRLIYETLRNRNKPS
jgi:hypothetical protein